MTLHEFQDVSEILRSGVYALVSQGSVVYVGKAKNLYARIYAHRNLYNSKRRGAKIPDWMPVKGMKFDEVHVRYVHVDRLDEVEREMINRYKPKFNQHLKSNAIITTPIPMTINGRTVTLNERSAPAPILERRV